VPCHELFKSKYQLSICHGLYKHASQIKNSNFYFRYKKYWKVKSASQGGQDFGDPDPLDIGLEVADYHPWNLRHCRPMIPRGITVLYL
jgi:hypothetical protein